MDGIASALGIITSIISIISSIVYQIITITKWKKLNLVERKLLPIKEQTYIKLIPYLFPFCIFIFSAIILTLLAVVDNLSTGVILFMMIILTLFYIIHSLYLNFIFNADDITNQKVVLSQRQGASSSELSNLILLRRLDDKFVSVSSHNQIKEGDEVKIKIISFEDLLQYDLEYTHHVVTKKEFIRYLTSKK